MNVVHAQGSKINPHHPSISGSRIKVLGIVIVVDIKGIGTNVFSSFR
jgi:hypothetical protein